MEHKEKADLEQALAWLRENSNPDARPGRGIKSTSCTKNRKKKKKKRKKNQNPKNHSLKRKWGNYRKDEGNNSHINTGCLPRLRI